jgi:archaellum component FlaC
LSVITKKLGKWLKRPAEPSEKEMIVSFIEDLENVLDSMEDMAEDIYHGYSEQVVQKRSFKSKMTASLPKFLQSSRIRQQNEKMTEIQETKRKMRLLKGTLEKVSESIESMDLNAAPTSNDEIGSRIYELAYPGESVTSQNVGTLEEKLKILENSFLTSMDQMNAQLSQLSQNLTTLTQRLDEQGVKLDQIDEKITEVDSKLQKVQSTLGKISRKLTQNRTLLALLAGSVIALVIVVIVL